MGHKKEIYCTVNYHFKRIIKIVQNITSKEYMKHRGIYVDVFNNHIDELNESWYQIHGDVNLYEDDALMSKYNRYIADGIQPYFDRLNKAKTSLFLNYYVDLEDCDIFARIKGFKDTKIWITLNLM